MNEGSVTTFYLLDLDRTLLDTEKAAELLRTVVARYSPKLAVELARNVEDYSLLGESFSMRDFIVEKVGEAEATEIEARFIAAASDQDLLNIGAHALMAYIRTLPDAAFGILTYGSLGGQTMKIRAAGMADVPSLVTGETFKGEQISSWRGEDGLYHLPEELGGGTAATIAFVDDKPFSFKGLTADCRGYWVKSLYDAGKEKLPSYITPVETLLEIIELEKALA